MKLDDLKPAWQQWKLMNAMNPLDVGEVLAILEQGETPRETKRRRAAIAIIMFFTLTFILQSG